MAANCSLPVARKSPLLYRFVRPTVLHSGQSTGLLFPPIPIQTRELRRSCSLCRSSSSLLNYGQGTAYKDFNCSGIEWGRLVLGSSSKVSCVNKSADICISYINRRSNLPGILDMFMPPDVLDKTMIISHLYLYLSKLVKLPGASGAFLRLLLDQFLFSPIFIGVFLSTLMTLEGRASQIVPKLQQVVFKEWISSVLVNWQLWIPFQFINFWFVPQQFQVLAANFVALIWNVILSFKAHREVLP
ncbi:hypothetical protein FEM48_Zijuj12G0010100 [Ziziphus jujuba var. spinosa]|uniref:Protein Mpv17 n=1 Tax=Ziziphus jujuba var. spinosa TaxID=714518 RepID=A0A978UAA3_ZIZJJ|nr:hypothetical protein FEM48_Zijuj12G0010100 [Ziziphus jujuba var. spinosa]